MPSSPLLLLKVRGPGGGRAAAAVAVLREAAGPQLPNLECVIKADTQHTRATPRLPVGTLTALGVVRSRHRLACLRPATAAAAVLLLKLPDIPHSHGAVAGTAEQVHAIRVQLQGVDLPAKQHHKKSSDQPQFCAR